MPRKISHQLGLLAGLVISLVPAVVYGYSSGTYGSGTYGSCQYGSACSITLNTGGTVNLSITPTLSGKCTIQSDSVSVLTDDANGYTLSLAGSTTNTALLNGANSIPPTSGTPGSPQPLSGNAWGYRIDGAGSFGNGPTTALSNVAPTGLFFSKIAASNQPADTIVTTTAAANPADINTVWYGACANTGIASGSYTSQVTYTAVAN